MRIRLTLGDTVLANNTMHSGRIRTRGTPLARNLPCCSKRLRDVAYHARMGTEQASVSECLVYTPDLSAGSDTRSFVPKPLQTARGISIIAMQLSSADQSLPF